MTQLISLALIDRNPDQPRKAFKREALEELAHSIEKRGLIQAITVRPKGYRYEIVAGERRWRAHKILVEEWGSTEFAKVRCNVVVMTQRERDIAAMIENVQRADMNPIEEAEGYQSLLDSGMTLDEVVSETGVGREQIKNRLNLCKLSDSVKHLVRSGQVNAAMGSAITWAPERDQSKLIRQISAGKLRTVEQVRHAAIALRDAADQSDAFGELPKASKQDLAKLSSLEAKIEQISTLVQTGFKDGECIAAKRVAPDRVKSAADRLALIRKHVQQMEHQLRCAAAQSEILTEAA